MPPARCVSHLPSRGPCRLLPSIGLLGSCWLPNSCVLGSDSWSPSNLLLGSCQRSVFFAGLILLDVFFGGSPGLEDTPGFTSLRGMPLVLPRQWPPGPPGSPLAPPGLLWKLPVR